MSVETLILCGLVIAAFILIIILAVKIAHGRRQIDLLESEMNKLGARIRAEVIKLVKFMVQNPEYDADEPSGATELELITIVKSGRTKTARPSYCKRCGHMTRTLVDDKACRCAECRSFKKGGK